MSYYAGVRCVRCENEVCQTCGGCDCGGWGLGGVCSCPTVHEKAPQTIEDLREEVKGLNKALQRKEHKIKQLKSMLSSPCSNCGHKVLGVALSKYDADDSVQRCSKYEISDTVYIRVYTKDKMTCVRQGKIVDKHSRVPVYADKPMWYYDVLCKAGNVCDDIPEQVCFKTERDAALYILKERKGIEENNRRRRERENLWHP